MPAWPGGPPWRAVERPAQRSSVIRRSNCLRATQPARAQRSSTHGWATSTSIISRLDLSGYDSNNLQGRDDRANPSHAPTAEERRFGASLCCRLCEKRTEIGGMHSKCAAHTAAGGREGTHLSATRVPGCWFRRVARHHRHEHSPNTSETGQLLSGPSLGSGNGMTLCRAVGTPL